MADHPNVHVKIKARTPVVADVDYTRSKSDRFFDLLSQEEIEAAGNARNKRLSSGRFGTTVIILSVSAFVAVATWAVLK